jgi:hypothetical protein
MNDPRQNFTVSRCCRNCHYFIPRNEYTKGWCNLPFILNDKADVLPTHSTCTCDAHTWKKNRHTVQKPALEVGAKLPEDVI